MQLSGGVNEFYLAFVPSVEVDVAGYEVFAVPGGGDFVPSAENQVYRGPDTQITIRVPQAGVWGVKVAAYDLFGDTELNFTPLMTCTVVDTVAHLLDALEGQITSSQLNQELNETLAQVGDLAAAYGSVADAATSAAAAIAAEAAAIQARNEAADAANASASSALASSQNATTAETAAADAADSAAAAATNATSAASYRTAAETAAAAATTSATTATAAKDSAETSAAAATTSATSAAASATAATQSASAASTSATTATTQAGYAATSASTAASSSTTAQTAASQAVTYAENAQGYAATAAGAASTASEAAGTITAQYTIKVDANGKVAGIGLWSDGATSSVEILANKFAIVDNSNPNNTVVPFLVSGGTIYMRSALIAAASVDTLKIAGNSVWVPDYVAYTNQTVALSSVITEVPDGDGGYVQYRVTANPCFLGPTINYAGGNVLLYVSLSGDYPTMYWPPTLYLRHSGDAAVNIPLLTVSGTTFSMDAFLAPFTAPTVPGHFYIQAIYPQSQSLPPDTTFTISGQMVFFAGKR